MAPLPPRKTATATKSKATIVASSKAAPAKPLTKARTSATKTPATSATKTPAGGNNPPSAAADHYVGPAVVYTDDQAHCFYVVAKSKWDVDEYLLMLGLKAGGKTLASGLRDWVLSGWGTPLWSLLIRGRSVGAEHVAPSKDKITSLALNEHVKMDLIKLGATMAWFQTSKVELRAELETLAATAHSGSSIATGPSPPSLEEMARVAQVFGWGEGEPVEMALRLIRGSRPESPYYKVVSDLQHVAAWSKDRLKAVKELHGADAQTSPWPYGENFGAGKDNEAEAEARSAGFFANIRG